ncbi:hypothetical protein L6475_03965 [Prevotella sp. E9-3]|uniref:hypothetical protein n=1 Tax=Prevotella sp. E9-3 TaxID=2913621 RepID=UPI001EDB19C6|nr:hypothetical protein [Prevotella sp. E9-3]UKK49124.1 hypothetical protein L6475_03965 [Prevotella sp. E9-3]
MEQVNGVYQIGTADELIEFAGIVNGGATGANAVLTVDIDMTDKSWTPIGSISKVYEGTFDGQGYRISHLTINTSDSYQGLFGVVTDGVYIKNVFIDNTCSISGGDYTAGIVGGSNGGSSNTKKLRIENCGNEANINSNGANAAGIFGCNINGSSSVKIKNCYNTGNISGGRECGAISGWLGGGWSEVSNTYNTGTVKNNSVESNEFGRNNGCNFVRCYSTGTPNQGTSVTSDQIANGTLCGNLNSDQPYFFQKDGRPLPLLFCKKKAADGYYELANADDVKWFSERVWTYRYNELGGSDVGNVDCNAPLNARLTADIDFTDVNDYRPIGGLWGSSATRYTGTFDGQGHKISNLIINNGYDNQGFFGVISNGAVIKNMLLDNTCSISAKSAVGFIGKVWRSTGGDVYIQNCGNEATITSSGSNAGGILGVNQNNDGYVVLHMENCFNTGNVSGNESGGLTGWTGDNAVLTNCYTAGSSSATDFFARIGNGSTLTNCYTTGSKDNVTTITSEQVSNGNLAYLLGNTVWHQTIGTDRHPYPFSGDHMVVSKDNDDYYNGSNLFSIASGSELNTFATNYNNGMYAGACKVKLTSDLDMYGISYPGIGVDSHYFVGVLDGQGYIISNLRMIGIDHDNIGFINAANAPSSIRNLTLDNSCSINVSGMKYVGGIMGACFGDGIVSFYNCGNEAAITANKNPGGILGCNLSGGVTIQMKNCYNTGAITGANFNDSEGGGISGWLGNNSVITNCYSTGSVSYGEAFARGNSATVTNCYALEASGGGNCVNANYTKTADEFADGTVFAKLFDYTNDDLAVNGNVWRMDYDAATPHPVLYGDAIAMREDCTNRMIEGTYDLTLYRIIKQGGWNTFCVPFDMTSAQITAYFGAGTEVAVLDESKNGLNDDVLHFKQVNEIEAGQAYLVYPGVAADFSSKAIEGVTISATSPQDGITQAGFTFKGVYEPTALDAAVDRIVVSGNKIVKTTGGKLNGFRAYFKPTGANARATRFVIDDDDVVTGIITAEGEVIMDQPVYNLRGQRVQEGNSSSRGLLIKGGKKYVKM